MDPKSDECKHIQLAQELPLLDLRRKFLYLLQTEGFNFAEVEKQLKSGRLNQGLGQAINKYMEGVREFRQIFYGRRQIEPALRAKLPQYYESLVLAPRRVLYEKMGFQGTKNQSLERLFKASEYWAAKQNPPEPMTERQFESKKKALRKLEGGAPVKASFSQGKMGRPGRPRGGGFASVLPMLTGNINPIDIRKLVCTNTNYKLYNELSWGYKTYVDLRNCQLFINPDGIAQIFEDESLADLLKYPTLCDIILNQVEILRQEQGFYNGHSDSATAPEKSAK